MAESHRTAHFPGHGGDNANARWEEFFIAQAVEGVLTISRDGLIQSINRAAEEIFRCPAAEMVGTPFERLIPERLRERHGHHMAEFSRSQAHSISMGSREPLIALRANGEEFGVEISVVRLSTPGQEGWACLVRDVTEKRLFEEAILQGRKLESLSVLAAGIAHDFNNILTVLMGNAAVALNVLPADSPAREAIEDMRDASQRAAEMVRQLVQFAGGEEIQALPVDLNQLARETAHLAASTLAANCSVEVQTDSELPLLRGDATSIRRVIMNLVLNASEALGEKGGHILVQTSRVEADRRMLGASKLGPDLEPGAYAALTISDNGPGIDPAVRAKMFDPFFTTRFPGRGLGLANVFGIVRAHQGAIRVTSRVGRGATFRVLLPLPR